MTMLAPSIDVERLRSRVNGKILTPGDVGFEEIGLPWNRAHRHNPAIVGIPESTSDVVEMVRFASGAGLAIGVQATGHGVARPVDDGMLILTRKLSELAIDPVAATARIGAGVLWGPVLAAAQQHGLAPLLGSSPNVGAVGYTLGGGLGWLSRKFGLGSDSVLSFDVVTVDGRVLRVAADENEELFWGLRGGGAGSLVIVTAMEVRLFPVTTVYAGSLFYPAEVAAEVMARWRDWVPTVPDSLTSAVAIKTFPPLPHVPEGLRGKSFAIVRGCHVGPMSEGEALIDHWRAWRRPEMDSWDAMQFKDIAVVSSDPVDPSAGRMNGGWISDLTDDAIQVLIGAVLGTDRPTRIGGAEVRHAGGAISALDPDSSAYGNRDAQLVVAFGGGAPTPDDHVALLADLAETMDALEGVRTGGSFLNFLDGENRRGRSTTGVSSPERMVRLKEAIDPNDVMSHGLDFTR
jgi:FAD/FMN-containing dehydrogenase